MVTNPILIVNIGTAPQTINARTAMVKSSKKDDSKKSDDVIVDTKVSIKVEKRHDDHLNNKTSSSGESPSNTSEKISPDSCGGDEPQPDDKFWDFLAAMPEEIRYDVLAEYMQDLKRTAASDKLFKTTLALQEVTRRLLVFFILFILLYLFLLQVIFLLFLLRLLLPPPSPKPSIFSLLSLVLKIWLTL